MNEIETFLSNIENSVKRKDSYEILAILEEISGSNVYINGCYTFLEIKND